MSTQSNLAELYTAFFNRAPDSAGLAYWVNQLDSGTISLEQIAKNWVESQPEGQAKYPDSMTTTEFVNSIYDNVLNRVSDSEGLAYWQAQLDSGAISRDTFVAAVINGAKGNTSTQGQADAALLANKASVGIAFADKGLNDVSLAATVLTSVSAANNSLTATLNLIKLVPSAAAGQTPAVLNALNTALNNVANLIKSAPGELGDLATYLNTVVGNVSSSTNLTTLFTSINTKVVAAQTNPAALDNPANQAGADVTAATPSTGGGDTGGNNPPVTTFSVTVDGTGALKYGGSAKGDVTVKIGSDGTAIFTRGGIDATQKLAVSGVKSSDLIVKLAANAVGIKIDAATALSKTGVFDLNGKTYTINDSLQNVAADIANTESKLDYTSYALNDTHIALGADLSVEVASEKLANAQGIIDGASNKADLGAIAATYTLSDSAAALKDANANLVLGHDIHLTDSSVSIATVKAVQSAAGAGVVTYGTVVDTVATLKADIAANNPLTADHSYTINDSLENVAAELANVGSPLAHVSYALNDTQIALGTNLSVADADEKLANAQGIIDGASNSEGLDLIDATYTLSDSAEALVGADAGLLAGREVAITDGASISEIKSVQAVEGIGAVTYGTVVDTIDALTAEINAAEPLTADHVYIVNDSLQNVAADMANTESALEYTSYVLTDTHIALGADLSVEDASAKLANAQGIIDGASNSEGLDLIDAAYTLSDSAAALKGANAGLLAGHAVAITDGASISEINAVQAVEGIGAVTYGTIVDTIDSLTADVAAVEPVTAHHIYIVNDTLDNVIAYENGVTKPLTFSKFYLSDSTVHLGSDITASQAEEGVAHAHAAYDNASGAPAPLLIDYTLSDTIENLVNGSALLEDHAFTVSDSLANISEYLNGDTSVLGDSFTYSLTNAHIDVAASIGVAAALELYQQYETLLDGAVNNADFTLDMVFNLHGSADELVNATYSAVVAGQDIQIDDNYVSFDQLQAVKNAVGVNGGSVSYNGIEGTITDLLSSANSELIDGHDVTVIDALSLEQLSNLFDANVDHVDYTAVTDTAAHLSASLPDISGKTVVVNDSATILQLTSILGAAPGATYSAITGSAADLVSSGVANEYIVTGVAITVNGAISIADLATVDLANGPAGVDYTAVTDSAAQLSTHLVQITGKAVTVNSAVDIAQLTLILEVASSATYDVVADGAAALASHVPQITGKLVAVTDAASTAQLTAILAAAPGAAYSAVTDSAANLAANTSLLAGKAVVVNDAATVSQLTTIKGVAPSAAYTAVTGTATELVSSGTANVYITNGIAVTVTGPISLADLAAIDAANGVSTGVIYSAVADTAVHLAAGVAFLAGKNVEINDAASISQLTAIKGVAPTVTYTAVTDTAAQLVNHGLEIAGKTVVVSGPASTSQLTSILASAPGAAYTSVTDTAALLAANPSLIGGKTVVVTDAASITQLNTIESSASSTNYTAVKDTAAQLSSHISDITGKSVVVSDAATILQLGLILGEVSGAAYSAITDSATNLVVSGTVNNYVVSGTAVTVTDAISIADLAAVDLANGPASVTYTAVTDTAAQLSLHASQLTGKTVVVSGVTDTTELMAILAVAPDATYNAVTDTAANLAAHYPQIIDKTLVVTTAASIEQLNTILLAQNAATYTAVTDTAAQLVANQSSITGKTVVITDAASISQLNFIQAQAVSTAYTAVTDTAAQLSTHLSDIATKIVVVNDPATISQLTSILAAAPNTTYTAITDSVGHLVSGNTADGLITSGVVVTVSGAISINELAAIDSANGSAAVVYTGVTDSAAQLSTHLTQITGKTVTVNDVVDISQLTAILGAVSDATYTAVADTAAQLSTHLSEITDKTVVVTGGTTIAELALIQGAAPDASYSAVSDNAEALATHILQITGKTVGILDSASIDQLTLILDAVSDASYNTVTDSAALLSTHIPQITDKTVVVTDAATISQLNLIHGATADVTYTAVTGDAADLAANIGGYVKDAVNVTVTGSANLDDLATIGGYTTGKVTALDISDTASALMVDGLASKYIGEGSNVTVSGAATIAQLKAIDEANGTTGSIGYTSISDTIENLTASGASTYYGSDINVLVTDAVTINQLKALDLANGTVTYTVDLNETAAALYADAITNGGHGTFTAGRNVTISDDVSVSQLNTIDTAAATVDYSAVKDSAAALVADATAGLNARIAANGVTHVTVDGDASLAQLKSIDDATAASLVYTQIADTADNLIANANGYVSGSVTVTVLDTAPLTATQLANIDALTSTTVNASAVTGVSGTFAGVDNVLKATGLHLSGAESVVISDSAANLSGKTLALTTTSTHDELHVDLTTTSTNLKGLTGFEDIYLAGSGRLTQVVSIADGDNVTMHAAGMSSVVMGTGQQSFISSAGNDTVSLSAGSTFVFADSGLTNGTDVLNNFVTGSANSTLDFKAFLGSSYAAGTQIINSTSEFGGGAGTVALVKGDDVAVGSGFGLASANTISVADFTSGYLSAVSGKEVLITLDNAAHTANVYFVNSAGGGNATTVDSASDIVKVGTITLTGAITDVSDLHTTAAAMLG